MDMIAESRPDYSKDPKRQPTSGIEVVHAVFQLDEDVTTMFRPVNDWPIKDESVTRLWYFPILRGPIELR